jgi:hypothetical protein
MADAVVRVSSFTPVAIVVLPLQTLVERAAVRPQRILEPRRGVARPVGSGGITSCDQEAP